MKTITRKTKVYEYKELSDKAKEKVLEHFAEFNLDYEWWEFVYEDAKQIGLEITEFDIDRGSYCKGNFILSHENVANEIIKSHGESCETYRTASHYLAQLAVIRSETNKDNEPDTNEIDREFKYSLLEDYRIMLQHEYEYLSSREAIKETIKINDYQFTFERENIPLIRVFNI